MNVEKTWKPLSISGAVLIINSTIFSTIMLATGSDAFWGVGIGCFGAGFPLLTLGLLQYKKFREQNDAGSL
jgi:hypothetical protein